MQFGDPMMTPSRPNTPAKASRKPNVDPWYDIKRDMLTYVLEPATPRAEFEGKSREEEWADELLQMDTDFGTLLDYLTSLDVNDNNIFPATTGRRN
jgi:hypothetical protein